jgi:hypothetical protein
MLAAPASLACKEKCTLRTQATTGQPKQSDIPCAMVDGLYALCPESGLVSLRRSAKRPVKLDPQRRGIRTTRFRLSAKALSSTRSKAR